VKVYRKEGRGWKHRAVDISNTKEQLKKMKNEACKDGDVRLLEELQEFKGNDVEELLFALGYNREYSDKYLFTTVSHFWRFKKKHRSD
jgi:hypothetical protein